MKTTNFQAFEIAVRNMVHITTRSSEYDSRDVMDDMHDWYVLYKESQYDDVNEWIEFHFADPTLDTHYFCLKSKLVSPSHSEETETTENTGKHPEKIYAVAYANWIEIQEQDEYLENGNLLDLEENPNAESFATELENRYNSYSALKAEVENWRAIAKDYYTLNENTTESISKSLDGIIVDVDKVIAERDTFKSDNEAKEKRIQELERLLNESNSVMGTAKRRIVFLEGYSEGKHEPSDKYVRQINEAIKANDQALTQ